MSQQFDPSQVWHTGQYDIYTDRFIGGELATVAPDGSILTAVTVEELRQKWREVSEHDTESRETAG